MDNNIHYDYHLEYEGIPSMLDQILDTHSEKSQFVQHEVSEMWKDDGRDSFRIDKQCPLLINSNGKVNLAVNLTQGNYSKCFEIIKKLETLKWSEDTTFCMCLVSPYYLEDDAELEEFSVFFENAGFSSIFYKGTD